MVENGVQAVLGGDGTGIAKGEATRGGSVQTERQLLNGARRILVVQEFQRRNGAMVVTYGGGDRSKLIPGYSHTTRRETKKVKPRLPRQQSLQSNSNLKTAHVNRLKNRTASVR